MGCSHNDKLGVYRAFLPILCRLWPGLDMAAEYCRCFEPAKLDLHWYLLAAFPRGSQGSRKGAPAALPKLDVPLGSDHLRGSELFHRPSAGMVLIQPQVRRRRFRQLLPGATNIPIDDRRLEAIEEDEV